MQNNSSKMNCFPKQRFTPYAGRHSSKLPLHSTISGHTSLPSITPPGLVQSSVTRAKSFAEATASGLPGHNQSGHSNLNVSAGSGETGDTELQKKVTLQLNNLDSSYDETFLENFLISLLKPITPIVSLHIDGNSSAKVEVPSSHVSHSNGGIYAI